MNVQTSRRIEIIINALHYSRNDSAQVKQQLYREATTALHRMNQHGDLSMDECTFAMERAKETLGMVKP